MLLSVREQGAALVAQHLKLEANIGAIFSRKQGGKLGLDFDLLFEKSTDRGLYCWVICGRSNRIVIIQAGRHRRHAHGLHGRSGLGGGKDGTRNCRAARSTVGRILIRLSIPSSVFSSTPFPSLLFISFSSGLFLACSNEFDCRTCRQPSCLISWCLLFDTIC